MSLAGLPDDEAADDDEADDDEAEDDAMALCLRRGVQSRLLQGRGVWTVLSTVVWGWESGWLGPTHGKAVRKDHTLCSGSPVVARGCGGGRLVFVPSSARWIARDPCRRTTGERQARLSAAVSLQ